MGRLVLKRCLMNGKVKLKTTRAHSKSRALDKKVACFLTRVPRESVLCSGTHPDGRGGDESMDVQSISHSMGGSIGHG